MIQFAALLERYDLDVKHVYLLPLVPLIETMWADGACQEPEKEILFECTRKHVEKLQEMAGGEEVISMEEAFDFLRRFLYDRPAPLLLEELRNYAVKSLNRKDDLETKQELVDRCLDIAAACVSHYPYKSNERIMAGEKQLISDLISRLKM